LRLGAALGLQALEVHVAAVDVRHRPRDRAVPRRGLDELVHRVRHAPVGRVALRARAELDQVHRLARAHLHDEADAVRHRDRVLRDVLAGRREQRLPRCRRVLHHRVPLAGEVGVLDDRRGLVPVHRGQALPLEREGAVALEVAEGAVVAEDVEAVAGALERAARLVAPVAALADVGAQQCGAIVR
jgi:hypothetical protein